MWTGIDFFDCGFHLISYGDFSKWPVRPYKNCTGQIWYVHWFPSWKVCFGPNSIAVQSWEVCALKLNYFNGDPVLAVENSSKWPVRPYTNCTGQIWYDHWFPSWKVCFGPNSIALQSWEVCALEIEFFQWRSCVSYREFFKVTCAAYTNCTGTRTVQVKSGKGGPILAIENHTSKSPVRPYTNCTGQIWYVHWFPSWKVCFGPNSIAVQSWEVCELEFDFFDCGFSFN